MPEAAKPATDKAANPAVETDAAKKEKAAADGALDKMKSEVADATKPGEKKTEDAAKTDDKKTDEKKPEEKKPEEKKTEEVVKKPEEAKKPEDDSLFNRLYDGVGNTWSALWNIRQPEKSADAKAISDAAKPVLKGNVEFLDFSTPIAGYDAKSDSKKDGKVDLKVETDKLVASDKPAENNNNILGTVGDIFSSSYNFVADKAGQAYDWGKGKVGQLYDYTSNLMGNALDQAESLDSVTQTLMKNDKYTVKTVESKDEGLQKILLDAADGSSTTAVGRKLISKESGDLQTYYNRETKESHIVDKKTGGSYDRLSDGSEVFTTKDGTKYVKRSNDQVDIVKGDTVTSIQGDNVYQQFGPFQISHHVGETWANAKEMRRHRPKPDACTTVDNAQACTTTDGTTFAMTNNRQGMINLPDGTNMELDLKSRTARHLDKDGKVIESGTLDEMARRVKGLQVTEDSMTIAGSNRTVRFDAATGKAITEMTDPASGKTLTVERTADGVSHQTYKDRDGSVIEQNIVNYNDPEKRFVELDKNGKELSVFNAETNSFATTDGSLNFTPEGTQLFGGEVYVDGATGDISYRDGTRLSNSSPGAYQASDAIATSASTTASGIASSLVAKAANPATVSAGEISQGLAALGSISGAINACLTTGNFAGLAQCISAKSALEGAIGVMNANMAAMNNGLKMGLSANEANEMGRLAGAGGTMSNEQAIAELKRRQGGNDQSLTASA